MGKKIKKTLAKFDLGHQAAKSFGLPEPSGDALYGSAKALSPAEQAQKAAKAQAQQAESQAMGEAARAAEAARGGALAQQAEQERQRVLGAAKDMEQVEVGEPEVELAPATAEAAKRRKRFQTTSVGGAAGGPSIRL